MSESKPRRRSEASKQQRRQYTREYHHRNRRNYTAGKVPPQFKYCSGCGKTKAANEFHVDSHSLDGLAYQCADCRNEYFRQRRASVRSI